MSPSVLTSSLEIRRGLEPMKKPCRMENLEIIWKSGMMPRLGITLLLEIRQDSDSRLVSAQIVDLGGILCLLVDPRLDQIVVHKMEIVNYSSFFVFSSS